MSPSQIILSVIGFVAAFVFTLAISPFGEDVWYEYTGDEE